MCYRDVMFVSFYKLFSFRSYKFAHANSSKGENCYCTHVNLKLVIIWLKTDKYNIQTTCEIVEKNV